MRQHPCSNGAASEGGAMPSSGRLSRMDLYRIRVVVVAVRMVVMVITVVNAGVTASVVALQRIVVFAGFT